MITLEHDHLMFRFPEVHADAVARIGFQRTLRIPDDGPNGGKDYPLPPGFGPFPLRHVDDFARTVPAAWKKRGGVAMPMHQAEAMWLSFAAPSGYPFAVKIATGKINAVTGEAWEAKGRENLNRDPQDYVVIPDQPWLDGYCVEKGTIRQFVAMPLGEGYSVEEQVTGAAGYGGVQIAAWPMKAERWEELRETRQATRMRGVEMAMPMMASADAGTGPDMGLAAGGQMSQDIYDDPYGLDAWDLRHSSRVFVSISNSVAWAGITGEAPPTTPPGAQDYANAGLPWFDWYGGDRKALEGAGILKGVKSVAELGAEKNQPLDGNASVVPGPIHTLSGDTPPAGDPRPVREAKGT